MVSTYMFHKVRELKSEGKSRTAIARELGINPKTVSKYLNSNTAPQYKARDNSTREDPFKSYEDKVKGWLQRTPTLSDQEIYEFLIQEGYQGSERTINRRLKTIRLIKPKERFFEQEYHPGEQSQFDFKESVTLPFLDGPRLAHLLFGTLPYSDICYVFGYPFKNYQCYIDGIHSFFETIGGMSSNIRFDNLSPCVSKVLKGDNRIYTEDFKKAIQYYGFGLLPCAPGKGNEKGDVERDIRTFSTRIKNLIQHEGVIFKDWDHLNQWLMNYMLLRQTEDNKERFIQERLTLVQLPRRDESILCRIQVGSASSHGSVRVDKSAYSVPDTMIEKETKTVIGAYDIRIICLDEGFQERNKNTIIHTRKPDGEHSLHLEHILPSLVRKPHAMVRWAHRDILFPSPVCKKFYSRLKSQKGYAAEAEYLRSINLIHFVPMQEIMIGMELILETKSNDLFADLRELLLGERRPAPVIDITSRFNQKPLKPELSQYDSLIPNHGDVNL